MIDATSSWGELSPASGKLSGEGEGQKRGTAVCSAVSWGSRARLLRACGSPARSFRLLCYREIAVAPAEPSSAASTKPDEQNGLVPFLQLCQNSLAGGLLEVRVSSAQLLGLREKQGRGFSTEVTGHKLALWFSGSDKCCHALCSSCSLLNEPQQLQRSLMNPLRLHNKLLLLLYVLSNSEYFGTVLVRRNVTWLLFSMLKLNSLRLGIRVMRKPVSYPR